MYSELSTQFFSELTIKIGEEFSKKTGSTLTYIKYSAESTQEITKFCAKLGFQIIPEQTPNKAIVQNTLSVNADRNPDVTPLACINYIYKAKQSKNADLQNFITHLQLFLTAKNYTHERFHEVLLADFLATSPAMLAESSSGSHEFNGKAPAASIASSTTDGSLQADLKVSRAAELALQQQLAAKDAEIIQIKATYESQLHEKNMSLASLEGKLNAANAERKALESQLAVAHQQLEMERTERAGMMRGLELSLDHSARLRANTVPASRPIADDAQSVWSGKSATSRFTTAPIGTRGPLAPTVPERKTSSAEQRALLKANLTELRLGLVDLLLAKHATLSEGALKDECERCIVMAIVYRQKPIDLVIPEASALLIKLDLSAFVQSESSERFKSEDLSQLIKKTTCGNGQYLPPSDSFRALFESEAIKMLTQLKQEKREQREQAARLAALGVSKS